MFSDDPDQLCAFPGPIPDEYREAIETGIWINETTIRSLENFIEFEPAGWLPPCCASDSHSMPPNSRN